MKYNDIEQVDFFENEKLNLLLSNSVIILKNSYDLAVAGLPKKLRNELNEEKT